MSDDEIIETFTSPVPENFILFLKDTDTELKFSNKEIALLLNAMGNMFLSIAETAASHAWQSNKDLRKANFFLDSAKAHLLESGENLRDLMIRFVDQGAKGDLDA